MTKSRTLRKAGAIALSLAMALSIAGTIPASAAAKKVKLSSSKGTITVDKTKKVTIKNTKKTNIKKVTFTYSKKKIAKATRKGLKITVKGLKAGKTTITAKITLKKAVAGKKVYKLKYKATVKKATPAPTATPGELKLSSVEAATRNSGQRGVNVLVAYFSAAISSLSPSDIEIRSVKTNDLFTVEKVDLASDKKSATLTLTGSSSAGTSVTFLQYNTDYKMIVKSGGKVLEKEFTIPAIRDGQVVTKVDKTNKKITVNGATEYTLSDDVASATDFVQILGRSVTFTFDKNNVISKLTLDEETVLYGSFKLVDTNNDKVGDAIQNVKDEKKYSLVTTAAAYTPIASTTGTSTVYGTGEVVMDAKDGAGLLAGAVDKATVEYAKVTLNGNGTVRSIISYNTFDKVEYAKATKETDLVKIDDKTESLKDFTVQKEDKDVAIAGIAAGDIVYFDSTSKNAIIYGSDTDKGKMSVYTGKFEVNTKRYDTGKSGYTVAQSIVADKKDTATTDAVLGKYKDTEVTVIFNWAGKVQKLTAGDVAASTSDVLGIITTKAKVYKSGSKSMIDVSVDSGEGAKSYSIDIANLTTITDFAGAREDKDGTACDEFYLAAFTAATDTATIEGKLKGAATANGMSLNTTTSLLKGDLVKLITKADGTVTGIVCGGSVNGKAGNEIGDSYLSTDSHRTRDYVAKVNDAATPVDLFKGGQTKVRTVGGNKDYILGSSTTLLLYDGTKVTKKTYGDVDFSFTIDAASDASSDFGKMDGVVRLDGDKVGAIVIYMGNAGIATTSTVTKVGIVKDYTTTNDTTKKFVDITIAFNGAATTLKDFANDVTVTTKKTAARTAIGGGAAGAATDWYGTGDAKVAVGKLVFVTETKEGKVTNISLADTTAITAQTLTLSDRNKDTYLVNASGHNGAAADQKLVTGFDASVPATIVTISADGTAVTPLTWTQYCELDATKVNSVAGYVYSGNYFDVVAVGLKTDANATLSANAKADIESLAAPTLGTNGASLDNVNEKGAKGSAISWSKFSESTSGILGAYTPASNTALSDGSYAYNAGTGTVVLEASATGAGDTYKKYFLAESDGSKFTSITALTDSKATSHKSLYTATWSVTIPGYAAATSVMDVTPATTATVAGTSPTVTGGTASDFAFATAYSGGKVDLDATTGKLTAHSNANGESVTVTATCTVTLDGFKKTGVVVTLTKGTAAFATGASDASKFDVTVS